MSTNNSVNSSLRTVEWKSNKVVMIEPVCFFNRFDSIYRYVNNPEYNNIFLLFFINMNHSYRTNNQNYT